MGLTKKIHERLALCDRLRTENLESLRALGAEAKRKIDYLQGEIVGMEKKLQADPDNKTLQNEYAGRILARQMFTAGANLSDSLTDQERGGQ